MEMSVLGTGWERGVQQAWLFFHPPAVTSVSDGTRGPQENTAQLLLKVVTLEPDLESLPGAAQATHPGLQST